MVDSFMPMAKRRTISIPLGLAASVAIGVGSYYLPARGCDGGDCTSYSWLFGVGLPVAILTVVFGRTGVVMATAIFVAAGAGMLAAGVRDGSPASYAIGAMLLGLAVGVLLVARWWRGLGAGEDISHLIHDGQPAVATVLDVHDAHVTVDHNPMVRLRVRMEPTSGAPAFEAAAPVLVSRVRIPVAGQRYAAFYDAADTSRVRVIVDLPDDAPEHARRLHDSIRA